MIRAANHFIAVYGLLEGQHVAKVLTFRLRWRLSRATRKEDLEAWHFGAAGAFPGHPSRSIRPAESQGLHRSGRSGERWVRKFLYNIIICCVYNCTGIAFTPTKCFIFINNNLHIEEPCVGECGRDACRSCLLVEAATRPDG